MLTIPESVAGHLAAVCANISQEHSPAARGRCNVEKKGSPQKGLVCERN